MLSTGLHFASESTSRRTQVPDVFLEERRGFEPLTSAVQAPARLTGSNLPFLGGSPATSALCATTRSS